jgi:uncharacterized protein YbjT (DUF2867 family)
LIGTRVVQGLQELGHDPVGASPSTGVNAVTGDGLAQVLKGADVVVDLMNSPSFEDAAVLQFFQTTSRNILTAEAAAGVGHHVALSVVGADRIPNSGYMRAKAAQEQIIQSGPIPYTIVRATQFFEFLGKIADSATMGSTVRLPPCVMQPMSADDVAAAVVDFAVGPALNGIANVAGPEIMGMDEAVGRYLAARGDARRVIGDPAAAYFGAVITDRSLVPGDGARIAPTHLAHWMTASAQPVA